MNATPVVRTRCELAAVLAGENPGLVPTMGALHPGHAALIQQAERENGTTVVSIFVNPLQFNDSADYQNYPRSLDDDVQFARTNGADIIFAPEADEMYGAGHATSVQVGALGERWEGAARPGHFAGVATVVTKLVNIVHPARSYFGEKDFQQLQIIRRVHADLNLPGSIIGVETIRDPDGLALSSRNKRLGPNGRIAARTVPMALSAMQRLVHSGTTNVDQVITTGRRLISALPEIQLDYLAIVEPNSLESVSLVNSSSRAIVAVTINGVRLIDNCALNGPDILAWA